MGFRQCPHCGTVVDDTATTCSHCREEMPLLTPHKKYDTGEGRHQMRRGMLYMWLAALFYYFAAGYSPLEFPFEVPGVLVEYILPFMFLAGAGLMVYGIFLRARA